MMDDDDDDDSVGWGRPRPDFSDLLPSTPTPEYSDDDGNGKVDVMDCGVDINRVAPLIDYPLPCYDGAPLGELNQIYVNRGITQGIKSCYTTWDNGKKSPHTMYTCVFTCPVSGEHFSAGNWDNEKGVTIADEVFWYKTKKYAMVAAAARTLDCFSLRRCQGTEKQPHQRCLDQPYLCREDTPKAPHLPSDVALPRPSSEAGVGAHAPLQPPKRALDEWYLSFSKKLEVAGIVIDRQTTKISPGKECYNSWSNQKVGQDTLFTAIYTCHLSGERFASGTLIGKEDHCKEDYLYFDGANPILENMIEDVGDDFDLLGVRKACSVWYKTKKEATVAAAGRALDCMRHRDNGTISVERYCKEEPYTFLNTPEMWKHVNRVGDDEFLNDKFLTTQFGVAELHSLLEEEHDEEYWRAKYKEQRGVAH